MKRKQTYKLVIMVILAGLMVQLGVSQPGNIRDNIRQKKIGFITDKVQFTTQEAQAFWPVYNSYTREMETLRRENQQKFRMIKQNFDVMEDSELEAELDAFIATKRKEVEITEKYHAQFKSILPARKVIRLYRAEELWKQELIKTMQEIRQQRMQKRQGGRPDRWR